MVKKNEVKEVVQVKEKSEKKKKVQKKKENSLKKVEGVAGKSQKKGVTKQIKKVQKKQKGVEQQKKEKKQKQLEKQSQKQEKKKKEKVAKKKKAQEKKVIKRTKTIQETLEDAKKMEEQYTFLELKKQRLTREKLEKDEKEQKEKAAVLVVPTEKIPQLKEQLLVRKESTILVEKKIDLDEAKKFINCEDLDENVHELDGFRNFKDKFLGVDGMFGNYKVLIGIFTVFGNNFYTELQAELKKKGFLYKIEFDLNNFINMAMDYDIAWVITPGTTLQEAQKNKFLNKIEEFMKAKKSLYLWVDNTPLCTYVNYITEKFFSGMKFIGNYLGNNILNKSEELSAKGTFYQNHPFAYGINNFYEGWTISHPINLHPDFKIFALNSEGNPNVIYAEENENHGRIIIDTGYTKLWDTWWNTTAGTRQYVSNANVWLTGVSP